MRPDKHVAAQRVADHLFEAEHALDEAIARLASLVAVIPDARPALGVALKTGAPALTKLARTLPVLAELRETVASAHDELAVVQRAIGVRPNMVGGGEKDPNSDLMSHRLHESA